jgi:hypothetical protein
MSHRRKRARHADGVALAAISELNRELESQQRAKDAHVTDLETCPPRLEKMIANMPHEH